MLYVIVPIYFMWNDIRYYQVCQHLGQESNGTRQHMLLNVKIRETACGHFGRPHYTFRPKKKVLDWRNPTDPRYPADPTYFY